MKKSFTSVSFEWTAQGGYIDPYTETIVCPFSMYKVHLT